MPTVKKTKTISNYTAKDAAIKTAYLQTFQQTFLSTNNSTFKSESS
jgi:hypothetical protein